jgi:hypothetical protein
MTLKKMVGRRSIIWFLGARGGLLWLAKASFAVEDQTVDVVTTVSMSLIDDVQKVMATE